MIALDASAVLALLFREEGYRIVEAHLPGSCISAVNVSEVCERMGRDGTALSRVQERLQALDLEVVPFTDEHAVIAASCALIGRSLGISLGDCACIATADRRGIPVLTADRAWAVIDLGVEVRLIR